MSFFSGKSVIVTGGCSGIGYAVVQAFLNQGIKNVAILDIIDTNNVSRTLQSKYQSQKVIFIATDVSKKDQVQAAFNQIIREFGYVDIVVGNAGIAMESDYERTINVNLIGVLNSTYAAIDVMSKEKGGHGGTIMNVASLAGLGPVFSMPAYTASKHGVVGLNRAFSNEYYLQKFGIKFITLCPGPTETPILAGLENKIVFGASDMLAFSFQKPASVAEHILEILSVADNGSTWIVENSKRKEVFLRQYSVDDSVTLINSRKQ